MTSCGVWNTEKETKQNFIIWSVLVAIPILIGPILTVSMEFFLYLRKKCSKNKQPETPRLVTYWVIILLSSSVILPLLSLHLWLTELLIELEFLKDDYATGLVLKYFIGNLDIFLVPCFVISVDPVIRHGLRYICMLRKNGDKSGPSDV